jgi:hypothetical protein
VSNVQIPNLPVAIALNGTEALEAVQSGTSVQTTVARIAQYSYAYYPGFYISQLPAASSVNSTDIFPVVQGSTGPNTGTTYKATVAQLFTSPTFTGTTTLGGGAANYVTITGAGAGNPITFVAIGSDTNIGITLTPKGSGTVRTNSLSVGNATARQPFSHSTYFSPVSGSMASAPFSLSGNAFGTVTSGAAYFRQFNINTDTVNSSAAQGGGVNVNYFGHTISDGAVGGRTTFSVFMSQQGATTSALGQYYVAGACFGEAAHSAGGTAGLGNGRGNLFATNHSARLKTGAGLYWNSLVGEEVDVSVQTGTSVGYKVGFKVVQWVDDAVAGTVADYAIGINNQANGTAPGWSVGFAVGAPEGWWPIIATGTILGTYAATIGGGPAMAAAYGVDFSAVTFSTAAFQSTGFKVDGSGNTTVGDLLLGASGPRIIQRTGAPPVILTLPRGTLYLRTDGAVGSTVYVSQGGGTWNAIAGV